MKPPFSAFALSLLCVLLLSACYFGHSYEICNTDSDCHETSECVEGLCLTRAEYQRCDPTRANLSTCPTGMACDRETAVCVATNDPDMGADTGTGRAVTLRRAITITTGRGAVARILTGGLHIVDEDLPLPTTRSGNRRGGAQVDGGGLLIVDLAS